MKLLAALSGLMLLVFGAAGFVFWRSAAVPCEDQVVLSLPSADGEREALVVQHRCGDADSTRVQLGIAGKARTRTDVYSAAGLRPPTVHWKGARALVVEPPPAAQLQLSEDAWRDVSVQVLQPR